MVAADAAHDPSARPSARRVRAFQQRVWDYYDEHGRHDLPWRLTGHPYEILVSEVMLQQTQVARVIPKFEAFVAEFPTLDALAAAPLSEVLGLWQGLGYNRRAVWLKRSAEILCETHGCGVPPDRAALEALPGVGSATAAGVMVFAFGAAVPYLETNVRAVYLHEFYPDDVSVPDSAIVPLVASTMDRERPREWFYALLDYGAHLKRTLPNPSRRSAHHARQSPFEGSNRQKRARVLRAVLDAPGSSAREIEGRIEGAPIGDVVTILEDLEREGFVKRDGECWTVV